MTSANSRSKCIKRRFFATSIAVGSQDEAATSLSTSTSPNRSFLSKTAARFSAVKKFPRAPSARDHHGFKKGSLDRAGGESCSYRKAPAHASFQDESEVGDEKKRATAAGRHSRSAKTKARTRVP